MGSSRYINKEGILADAKREAIELGGQLFMPRTGDDPAYIARKISYLKITQNKSAIEKQLFKMHVLPDELQKLLLKPSLLLQIMRKLNEAES